MFGMVLVGALFGGAIALDDGDAQAHEILAILLAHSNQLDAATAEMASRTS